MLKITEFSLDQRTGSRHRIMKEIGGGIVLTLPKLRGLYYITHIDNVPSILQRGILSHAEIERQSIHCNKVYDENIV